MRFALINQACYDFRVSAKKALIRCASLLEFAARSRNRTVCGFFHGTSYGGAVGRSASSCRSSLREFPGLAHPAALPPDVQVGRQSFNGTLEAIMANILTHVNFDRPPVIQQPRRGRFPKNIIVFWKEANQISLARALETQRLENRAKEIEFARRTKNIMDAACHEAGYQLAQLTQSKGA